MYARKFLSLFLCTIMCSSAALPRVPASGNLSRSLITGNIAAGDSNYYVNYLSNLQVYLEIIILQRRNIAMKHSFVSNAKKLLLVLILACTSAFSVTAAEYQVDIKGMHAFVQFRIIHLGYSVMVGRFNDFNGSFSWDKDNPASASISIDIETKSVDTNHAERDKHLREKDYLNVDKYPLATFRSTKYHGDASGGKMDGLLTLHGVTKSISLDVKVIGEGNDPWGGYRAGFEATTSIRRADFGMESDLGPAAETMDFDLFIEGVRK
jgi:polyisoprenoid-binding protein YceI